MLRKFAALLVGAVFAYGAGATGTRLTVSIPTVSADGIFHGRYPHGDAPTGPSACPQTSGLLTLRASVTRTTGVSPLLVFYDATATTDTSIAGSMTAFQDVTYTWNFGDNGTSGTSTWAYGSNPGGNSRNVATGGIAAHLYITQGSDTSYAATVTATDAAGNTASCTVGGMTSVLAYDPSGTNGFPGTATTCLFNSTVGGGCPVGATQTTASGFGAVSANLSGKRLLYKCGDTFTGDNAAISSSSTKWSVGAYGGCEGTQTNRPIFQDTGTNYHIFLTPPSTDGRIADIDFESSSGTSGGAFGSSGVVSAGPLQELTFVNLNSVGNKTGYSWGAATQTGLIGSVHNSTASSGIVAFVNYLENNCTNGNTTFNCGGTPSYYDTDYNAVMGDSIMGVGNGNTETLRISACRLCVVENDSIDSSVGVATVGCNLKFHSGNTNGTLSPWLGKYGELDEISDNKFGPNGLCGMEIAPQNGVVDERMRNIVAERNLSLNNTQNQGSRQAFLSGQNITFRDNAFNMESTSLIYPIVAIQPMTRGGTTYPAWQSINNEVLNNTCVVTGTPQSGQECVGNDGIGGEPAISNSLLQNTMMYATGSGAVAVHDTGSGNTTNHNTATPSANPAFTNGSGTFTVITDFKPTANFSGGTSVPNFYDALGIPWSPTWELGAVHH